MLVLEPLKVVIEGLPEEYEEIVEVPFSKDPAFGVSGNTDIHLLC
jgi:glutaminyl-tRNA synthetase